jgi:hypothetical protein
MERRMLGNWHVRCGAGEKPEITSNVYLLLTGITIYPKFNSEHRYRYSFCFENELIEMHELKII